MPDTDLHPPMTGSRSNVADRVVAVLKRVRTDPIEPTMGSALVADLGFDSLRMLELVAELEDEFGIFIPLNDVPAITTVQQAVDRVVTLLGEQGRA
jgi:acyl carrier protein